MIEMRFNPLNIYKVIDGKKYSFIGVYPKDEELIGDLKRAHRKHGFIIEVIPDEYDRNKINLYKRRGKK